MKILAADQQKHFKELENEGRKFKKVDGNSHRFTNFIHLYN